MAKQTGILPLTGTVGGINFYIRKGIPVARKAGGGFTAKAIKTSPAMDRIRDNNTEFGHCSRIKKLFKDSLFPFFGLQKNEDLHGRMMRLFLEIKKLDPISERGKRRINLGLQTDEGRRLLMDFAFTPLSLAIPDGTYDAPSCTYTVPNFDTKILSYPNHATHLEVRLGVVVLDFEGMKATLFESETIRLAKASPGSGFSLTPATAPSGNGMRISVLGYRYVQEVNGAFYPLKDKVVFGLRILNV